MFCREGFGAQRGRGGFTIVELVVAVAIAAVLLAVSAEVMVVLSTEAEEQMLVSDAHWQLDRLVGQLSRELESAYVIEVAEDGTRIDYQLPVDLDGQLGPVSKAALGQVGQTTTELGIIHPHTGAAVGNGFKRIEFVTTREIAESQTGLDVNANGSLDDRFAVGFLGASFWSSSPLTKLGEERGAPSDFCTLQRTSASGTTHGLDIDGDGAPDPIFVRDAGGYTVVMRLWALVEMERSTRAILVRKLTAIPLHLNYVVDLQTRQ